MLTEEQIVEVKKQIFQQIASWPEDQRVSAKAKIDAMDPEEFEDFLIKNKMIKGEDSSSDSSDAGQQCIFCSLVEKKIPSSMVAESATAVAVLEINPVSKGHILVIPKKHIVHLEEADKEFMPFVQAVAISLRESMKLKGVDRWAHSLMGHVAVNLIPLYEDTQLDFPRKKSDPEELKGLAQGIKGVFDRKKEEEKAREQEKSAVKPAVIEAPFRRP